MTDDDRLVTVLGGIRDRGAIGEASLDAAIAHAEQFVRALPSDAHSVVDLGSGGGLPGLVIAVRRPELRLALVERRATRADLLRRAVAALALGDRVSVHAVDVREYAEGHPAAADAVTARSFAAPSVTAQWAAVLLRPGGWLVVSEPPEDDPSRWPTDILATAGLRPEPRDQGVRRFQRV